MTDASAPSSPLRLRLAPLAWAAVGALGAIGLAALAWSGAEAVWVGTAALAALFGLAVVALSAPPVRVWLPAASLLAVLALSLVTLGADEGVDALDVAFGVALVLYIAAWYGIAVVGGLRLIRTHTDVAVALFLLAGGVGGGLLSVVSHASGVDLRSDLTCLLVFGLFFPVRELCARSPNGPRIIAAAIIGVGLVASTTNALRLLNVLTGASAAYELVDVRLASGEIQIIGALSIALVWLSVARRRVSQIVLFGLVAFLIAGLILTKSRGSWLTAAVGMLVTALAVPWSVRARMGVAVVGGAIGAAVAGVAVAGAQVVLIGVGLLKRLTSISTAATGDISLLNRYAESAATWDAIAANPILGYGWGVPVIRYDLIIDATFRWGFVHNGYLWLWHKVGLWGLLLFVLPLLGTIWHGIRTARLARVPIEERALAAGGAGALVAFGLLALPSNPFAVLDQMLIVAVVLGFTSGLWVRSRAPSSSPA